MILSFCRAFTSAVCANLPCFRAALPLCLCLLFIRLFTRPYLTVYAFSWTDIQSIRVGVHFNLVVLAYIRLSLCLVYLTRRCFFLFVYLTWCLVVCGSLVVFLFFPYMYELSFSSWAAFALVGAYPRLLTFHVSEV